MRTGDPAMLADLVWAGVHGGLALPVNVDSYSITLGDELATEMVSTLLTAITNDPDMNDLARSQP